MNKKIMYKIIITILIILIFIIGLSYLIIFLKGENNSEIDHTKIPSSSYVPSELQSNNSEFINNFKYESVNISELEPKFIDALILKEFSKKRENRIGISDRTIDFPVVNMTTQATWIALKIEDNYGHESIAIVPINSKGFKSDDLIFLTSEKPYGIGMESNKNRKIKVLEYIWDRKGDNILYSYYIKDNKNYQIKIAPINGIHGISSQNQDRSVYKFFNNGQCLKWKDGKKYRSNFCYIGPDKYDFIYRSGKKGLCKLGGNPTDGFYDNVLVRGDIFEPIYIHSMNKILYYKYDNNDAGIYENTLDGQHEKKLLNLSVFSEISPKFSSKCNMLAFLSNYHKGFQGSSKERDELSNKFRLYASRIDQLKNISEINPFIVKDYINAQTFRDVQFRNQNTIKWLDTKLFFIPTVVQSEHKQKIGYWDCVSRGYDSFKFTQQTITRTIKTKAGSDEHDYSFKINKINSFDIFQRDRKNYIVTSASVSFDVDKEEKTDKEAWKDKEKKDDKAEDDEYDEYDEYEDDDEYDDRRIVFPDVIILLYEF
ncbi:hypothetical protein GMMP1_300025 [Candidatus Magnetomoraceae bacterium gMMP-1]